MQMPLAAPDEEARVAAAAALKERVGGHKRQGAQALRPQLNHRLDPKLNPLESPDAGCDSPVFALAFAGLSRTLFRARGGGCRGRTGRAG